MFRKIVVKEKSGDLYFYLGQLRINKIVVGCVITAILALLFSFKLGGFDKIAKDNIKLSNSNKEYKEELKTANDEIDSLTKELDNYKVEEKKAKDLENSKRKIKHSLKK